jgi:hypothetical protein
MDGWMDGWMDEWVRRMKEREGTVLNLDERRVIRENVCGWEWEGLVR